MLHITKVLHISFLTKIYIILYRKILYIQVMQIVINSYIQLQTVVI
jgi:hypothetical protein